MTDWNLAINVTVTGITLVFSMLVLLVLILTLFGILSENIKKSTDKKAARAKQQALSAMADDANENPVITKTNSRSLNNEIVAAISAAISVMYAGSSKKPVIKSIKKSSGRRSAWASAGIQNNTRSF